MRTCTGDGSSPVGQWNGTAPNCTGKGHAHKGKKKKNLFEYVQQPVLTSPSPME